MEGVNPSVQISVFIDYFVLTSEVNRSLDVISEVIRSYWRSKEAKIGDYS